MGIAFDHETVGRLAGVGKHKHNVIDRQRLNRHLFDLVFDDALRRVRGQLGQRLDGTQPIAGKKLLVAGLGGIGSEVARLVAALGMQVSGTRNSSRSGQEFMHYVGPVPTRLSSDNDPLFDFHRWKANLRILEIAEIKTVPYVPLSHPFIERLIGTIRREFLDQAPFRGTRDLQSKLQSFQRYYNWARAHQSLGGRTPDSPTANTPRHAASLEHYQWDSHCRGLFQLPIAA